MTKQFLSLLIFILLLINGATFANSIDPSDIDTGVKGKVIDKSTKKNLEYATVMIFQASDSSFVTGGITSATGEFDIKLKPGRYDIAVQFLAYGTVRMSDVVIERGRNQLDLGELVISPDAALLEEFEIIAEKSQVEMSLDKRVFNVGKDISSKASNAIEVLENIPSVTVDIDGNVSLRGDEGVRILVDGKMSGLAGISNRNALRSLQSDMIERIEIITNPSVRYDAEGSAGIINIVLKKDRRQGFNGSIDATTGYPLQAGLGINTNYRLNKWNLFANYSINYNERIGTGSLLREFNSDQLYTTEQERERKRKAVSNTIRLGAEYFINPLNSLTFSMMYKYSDESNRSTVGYRDFTDGLLTGLSERVDDESEIDPDLEYSLAYQKQFRRKDQLFTASVQYSDNNETEKSTIIETFFQSPQPVLREPTLQKSNNNELTQNIEAQADYFHPFAGKAKLETGVKWQRRHIDNDYEVNEQLPGGEVVPLNDFSNHFIYDENILAAYAMFGNDVGRYSYQLGIRVEYADIGTLLRDTDEEDQQNYINPFPSAHFTYKLTEADNIQLSYSRRIRRPEFRQLNPFRSFADNRNIWTGNPGLKPVYTDSYEIGYLRYWSKSSFNATTYYRNSRDVFQRIERIEDSGTIYIRPENFARNQAFGLELIGSVSPYKWWNMNTSLNFFRSITEGDAYGISYNTDFLSWNGRINNRLTLAKSFDMQVSGNYAAGSDTPQGKRLPSWSVDLGLSKDIFKNKGTITLNVRDVFGTRKHSFETFGENFYTKSEFQWSSTVVTLNLNYRINQTKKRQGEKRDQQSDEGNMEF
jgi:ferric enterobactin receptor